MKILDRPAVSTSGPIGRYAQRAIRFVELWRHRNWQFKIYGINPDIPHPDEPVVETVLVDLAKRIAVERLGQAGREGEAGYGFLIVHRGRLARWILVDCWREGILLDHWLHRADHAAPDRFEPVANGLCACVWELRVIDFEREAWTRCVLKAFPAPDYAGYVNARLDEDS